MPDVTIPEVGGLLETLGIHFEKFEPDEVVATMPVTSRHLQPYGFLHGGASVALAETVASAGGIRNCPPGQTAMGMEINANHLRPVRNGVLRAVAHPAHIGRSTHVWEVHIFDQQERLVCVSRCTLAVVDLPDDSPSPLDL